MKFGLSTKLYTPSEYLKVSLRQNALVLSLMTLIMLFFMISPQDYIHSKNFTKQVYLHVAAYSGMIFAILSSFDAFFRPKYPDLRICDEVAILAAYACLWSLLTVIFLTSSKWWFLGVLYVAAIVGGLLLGKYKYSKGPRPSDEIDETAKAFIAALGNNSSPAAANALTVMALYATVNQPGDPATSAMIEAALATINGQMILPKHVGYSCNAFCHNCFPSLARAFHIPAATATRAATATPAATASPVATAGTPAATASLATVRSI